MPFIVQDILDIIERIAPASLAEEWDNVGLMIGDPSAQVDTVMIGLDPTLQLLDETISRGANLLITHHPFIFHPLRSVHLGNPEGIFVERAIRNRVNVISCHTNFDSASKGVSYSLAQKLGLSDTVPLVVHPATDHCGLGCIGSYRQPVSPEEFIAKLRKACLPPWLLATTNRPKSIDRVAVCGGSCSELAPVALEQGAQVYVTAEVKHSTACWADQAGLWLVDAGHFATENQALVHFAKQLADESACQSQNIEMHVTRQQGSPLLLVE